MSEQDCITQSDRRWAGITRPYDAADVERVFCSM